MLLIDTSIWIALFRDKTGKEETSVREMMKDEEVVLTRFNQLELLQGCKNEGEWNLLAGYLADQDYVEMRASSWADAARLYFDLRRLGKTVRSPIDCCIAQLAIENEALLIHRDLDFFTIASIRPLKQITL